jgi:dTDP-4-amino-4,6-dideoxygalactose transaminase
MLDTPFSPWPCYSEDEIRAVSEVLRSNRVNYWTGTQCKEFEREYCGWTGAPYAIAVANGTVAIEMALRAARVGRGDEVVVTPRTFMASVSAAVNVGATPVFADVDRDTQNIEAPGIARVLTPKTRAIVCVHLAGLPSEMDAIGALAA